MGHFDIPGLVPGKTYNVIVRAKDALGNISPNSVVYSFTTPTTNIDSSQLLSTNAYVVQQVSGNAGLTAGAFSTAGAKSVGSTNFLNVWNGTATLDGTAGLGGVALNSTGIIGYKFGDPAASAARFFLDTSTGNAYFRGAIVATTASIGGANGIIYNGTTVTIGTDVTILGGVTASSLSINSGNYWLNSGSFNLGGSTGIYYSGAGNVTIGTGVTILGGVTASSLSINANNYWLNSGSFSVGDATRNIKWDTSGILTITGSISATSASFVAGTISNGLVSNGVISGAAINVPATSPKFTVDSAGNMVATSASLSGSVTATAGTIGGFTIYSGSLAGGTSGSYTGIVPGTTKAFFAGATNTAGNSASFYVTNSGSLVATAASITGNINATSGAFSGSITATTGSIGGFNIGSNALTGATTSSIVGGGLYGGSVTGTTIVGGSIYVPNATSPALSIDSSGNLKATSASITGNITAQSGSFTGDVYIASPGRLIAGNPASNYVILSASGLTGASAGIPTFTLPSDGTPPTLGAFQIVKTGLQAVGQYTSSVTGTISTSSLSVVAASAASSIFIGMAVFGTNIGTGATITGVAGSVIYLSTANTGAVSTTASFIPNANMVIGTDTSNNITVRGQTAPGLLPAIFTTISNTATTDAVGNGFYIGQDGKFRLAGNNGYVSMDGSGNLSVSGTIYATTGSFSGSVNATAGNFSGFISTGTIKIGSNVSSTSSGIYFDSNNYWLNTSTITGSLSIGNATNNITWDGTSNLAVNGTINKINIGRGGGDVTSNLAVGINSLNNNTTGSQNFAIGSSALYSNTSGSFNIAIGYQPLFLGTSSRFNIGIGSSALYSSSIGSYNIAIGSQALQNDKINNYNIAIGRQAMMTASSSQGNANIIIGDRAAWLTASVDGNTIVGVLSAQNASMLYDNVIIGTNAGYSLQKGLANVFVGAGAGDGVTTGSTNLLIGYLVGGNIDTGSGNVIIGGHQGFAGSTWNNNVILSDGFGNLKLAIDSNNKVSIPGTASIVGSLTASTASFTGRISGSANTASGGFAGSTASTASAVKTASAAINVTSGKVLVIVNGDFNPNSPTTYINYWIGTGSNGTASAYRNVVESSANGFNQNFSLVYIDTSASIGVNNYYLWVRSFNGTATFGQTPSTGIRMEVLELF